MITKQAEQLVKEAMDDWIKDLIKKDPEFRTKYNDLVNRTGGSYQETLKAARDHLGDTEFTKRHGRPFTEAYKSGTNNAGQSSGARSWWKRGPRGPRSFYTRPYRTGSRIAAGLALLGGGALLKKNLKDMHWGQEKAEQKAKEKGMKDLGYMDSRKIVNEETRAGDGLKSLMIRPEVQVERDKHILPSMLRGVGLGGVTGALLGVASGNPLRARQGLGVGMASGAALGSMYGTAKGDNQYLKSKGIEPQKGLKGLIGYVRANPEAIERNKKKAT